MPTYTLPPNLGDILGAHHDGNFNTQVSEIKAGIGVLTGGTCLQQGLGRDIGKLVKLAGNNRSTGLWNSSWIRHRYGYSIQRWHRHRFNSKGGTFKGSAFIVPTGVDAGLNSCGPSWTRHLHRRFDYRSCCEIFDR